MQRGLILCEEEDEANLARGLRGRFGRWSGRHNRRGGRCLSGEWREVLRALDARKRVGACCSPHDEGWVKERATRMVQQRSTPAGAVGCSGGGSIRRGKEGTLGARSLSRRHVRRWEAQGARRGGRQRRGAPDVR
jgi:hypothetical protein